MAGTSSRSGRPASPGARPAAPAAPATSPGQKLLLAAFGTLLAGGALVVIELALALLGWGAPDRDADPFVGFGPGRPLFVRQPESDLYATARPKLRYFNAVSFRNPAPRGSFRIFSLGGSTTYGRPYDHRVSYSRWLELLLEDADPGRRYEVINAGGISYASYRIVLLMRELVAYDPDLFIVYTGHNEFLEERTYRGLIHESSPRRALRRAAEGLRSVRLLRDGLGRLAGDEKPAATLSAEVRARLDVRRGLEAFERDDALREAIVEHFRYNVEQMIRIAREHGVPILFVAPASNIRDFPPFKSQHTPPLDEAGLGSFERLRDEARRLAEAGRQPDALGRLEEAARLSPDHAAIHYEIGRCRLALGDARGAEEDLVRAKELDVCPLRALDEIHAGVVEAARENDAPLVDFAAFLRRDSLASGAGGVPGGDYFLDHVHPRIEAHQRLAELILDALVERGLVSVARTPSAERRQARYAGALSQLEPAYFAQRDRNLGKVLGWAGQYAAAGEALRRALALAPDDATIHYDLGLVHQETGRPDLAARELEEAARLAPEWFEARFELGRSLQQTGTWKEAADSFLEALRIQPGNARAHYNLARCYRELGRPDREIEALQAAMRGDPRIPDVARLLGKAFEAAGRLDDALELHRRELSRHPGDAAAHADLAGTLLLLGDLEGAAEAVARGLELAPDQVEALRLRARIHEARGELEAAAKDARRVASLLDGDALAQLELARREQALERWEAAEAASRRAIELDASLASAHIVLGAALARQGRLEAAVTAFEKGLDLNPDAAGAHFHLASLHFVLGRHELAARHYLRAEELGIPIPTTLPAPFRERLESLRQRRSPDRAS